MKTISRRSLFSALLLPLLSLLKPKQAHSSLHLPAALSYIPAGPVTLIAPVGYVLLTDEEFLKMLRVSHDLRLKVELLEAELDASMNIVPQGFCRVQNSISVDLDGEMRTVINVYRQMSKH